MVNKLAREVDKLLTNLIGAFFAQATLKKIFGDMGVNPEGLGQADLADLADRIEKSVSFIKGQKEAARLAERIREL